MGDSNKKLYKLYHQQHFDPRRVSRWTRQRWKKVLLNHQEAIKRKLNMPVTKNEFTIECIFVISIHFFFL